MTATSYKIMTKGVEVSRSTLVKKEVKQMALDKTKVVYQIYPKSYKDTTGNGIGDFRGIIEKFLI